MNAENIMALVIVSVVSLIMIGIGVAQYKSTKPVGFWTGIEPPKPEEVSDVTAYNKKHAIMWILYGVGMIGCYVIGLMSKNVMTFFEIFCLEVFGGLVIMILRHKQLERKYVTKGEN